MESIGKSLLIIGIVLVLIGIAILFGSRIPLIGKLPGDIHMKKENFEMYIPLATGLLMSIFLSGLFWLFHFVSKK